MIAEELAMYARPEQPPVGINIDFGHTQFCSGQVFVFIYPCAVGSSLPPACIGTLISRSERFATAVLGLTLSRFDQNLFPR
jgi:hypothetical protein